MSYIAQVKLGEALKVGQVADPHGGSTASTVAAKYGTVASFLNLLIPAALVFAGIIFLFLLIGGGVSIIASSGNAKSVEEGQKKIVTAIAGLLVIFAAYWIVQIVEIVTGVKIFNSGL